MIVRIGIKKKIIICGWKAVSYDTILLYKNNNLQCMIEHITCLKEALK